MMKLTFAEGDVLIGLTHENLYQLIAGRVLQVPGECEQAPGVSVYICTGPDHETMRRDLAEAGYNLPRGNGSDGDGSDGSNAPGAR